MRSSLFSLLILHWQSQLVSDNHAYTPVRTRYKGERALAAEMAPNLSRWIRGQIFGLRPAQLCRQPVRLPAGEIAANLPVSPRCLRIEKFRSELAHQRPVR